MTRAASGPSRGGSRKRAGSRALIREGHPDITIARIIAITPPIAAIMCRTRFGHAEGLRLAGCVNEPAWALPVFRSGGAQKRQLRLATNRRFNAPKDRNLLKKSNEQKLQATNDV